MTGDWDDLPETPYAPDPVGDRKATPGRSKGFRAVLQSRQALSKSAVAADKARQRFVKVTLPKIVLPDDKDC